MIFFAFSAVGLIRHFHWVSPPVADTFLSHYKHRSMLCQDYANTGIVGIILLPDGAIYSQNLPQSDMERLQVHCQTPSISGMMEPFESPIHRLWIKLWLNRAAHRPTRQNTAFSHEIVPNRCFHRDSGGVHPVVFVFFSPFCRRACG